METKLNSELPLDELMKLSREIAPQRHMAAFNHWRRMSMILNKDVPGSRTDAILDLNGIKTLLARYRDRRVENDEVEEVPVGDLAHAEHRLRKLWREVERHHRINGRPLDRLPGRKIAENIVEAAAWLKLLREEARALEKKVKEFEAKAVEENEKKRQVKLRRRTGAYKRDITGRICQVDGMEVNSSGIIVELGIPADDYLAEARAKRKAARDRRNAEIAKAAENDESAA